MKRYRKRVSILLILLFLFSLNAVPIQGSSSNKTEKTVRVAYFDLGSYYQVDEDGTVNSYDSDYLNMISQYTGINFVYVDCNTWDQALEMLNNHEVDLVGTMQWTKEREEQYEICDTSYGYTVAELATLNDSDLIYEDYERMNGATVGYIEGYVVGDKLNELMEEQGISFSIKTYPNQSKLDQALEDGEIDLIAANAHAMHEDWKIVEKFAYAPFYFATWKGNSDLVDCISQTIIQINIHQANFDDALINKYFPIMVNFPYNKQEMDCIDKKVTYKVYLDTEEKPITWFDDDSDAMQGVLIDICEQLEQTTGLQLTVLPRTDQIDTDDHTIVTYRTLNYHTSRNASAEEGVTSSILDQNFQLYHLMNHEYKINGTYRIGVVENREEIQEYLKEQYPNCLTQVYSSPEQCMKQLEKGKVDLVFLNTYIAQNVMIQNDMRDIVIVPMTEARLGIALQFHGEDAKILSNIVDKGFKLIDEDKINEIMLQYAMNTTQKMTVTIFLQQHLGLFIGGCVVLFIIFVFCSCLWIYARIMKRQRNRMEEINQERTDFFARMSHDMRTPMNGILGMLELTDQTSDIEEIRSNIQKAMLSGKYMLSLINDTLDLQRIESKRLTLEPQLVCVKDFIDGIMEMTKPSAKQKNITFLVHNININDEHYIKIDQVRAKQVFVNIISNATKFTPENGVIDITLECLETEENIAKTKIVIRDTGIGMSKEFVANKLFKPYSQEYNKVTKLYAGSGLGLAIVKNLVELMGGWIEVESEIGEGTTFTIYLNFPYMEETAAEAKIQTKSNNIQETKKFLYNRHILLCEDHPLNAEIAKRLLAAVGCQTQIAQDGQQGLELFQSSELYGYDAILMDIRMPVMDGLQATKAIRALERADSKSIPIIAMTANAYDSDKENCKKAGMDIHLSKPIDVEELYVTLEKAIKDMQEQR